MEVFYFNALLSFIRLYCSYKKIHLLNPPKECVSITNVLNVLILWCCLFVTVCLPDPSVLPGHMITNIFLIFTEQLVLVGFEAYGLRLRRAISAFFYRKV